jgi:hypothetical protein
VTAEPNTCAERSLESVTDQPASKRGHGFALAVGTRSHTAPAFVGASSCPSQYQPSAGPFFESEKGSIAEWKLLAIPGLKHRDVGTALESGDVAASGKTRDALELLEGLVLMCLGPRLEVRAQVGES